MCARRREQTEPEERQRQVEHKGWASREMWRKLPISSVFSDRGVRTGTVKRRDGVAVAEETEGSRIRGGGGNPRVLLRGSNSNDG